MTWDVVVIGAGPAGASAAHAAAASGARTLLVDKASFPRQKVCGGCLNAAAIGTLRANGLDTGFPAGAYASLRLGCRGRTTEINIEPGVVVDRAPFDAWLVEQAGDIGVEFRDHTAAQLEQVEGDGPRSLLLIHGGEQTSITASVVVLATGLASGAGTPGWRVAAQAKIGLHAIVPGRLDGNHIEMAVGEAGYVGAAALPGDQVDVAAAVDPRVLRAAASPDELLNRLRMNAGFDPIPELTDASFRGTPTLTRRRAQPSQHRMLLVGDAVGYVEPFTGEGMAWALASGFAAGRLAGAHAHEWNQQHEQLWCSMHRSLVGRRQRACRVIRRVLPHPRLVSAVIAAANTNERLASRVASFAARPYTKEASP